MNHPVALIWPLLMLACAISTQGDKIAENVFPQLTVDTTLMKVYYIDAFHDELVIELEVVPHQCILNGVIRGHADSHVTLDTCSAGLIRGEMTTAEYKYTITPMGDSSEEHFLTREQVVDDDVTGSCGYDKTQRIPVETFDEDWSEDEMNATARERRDAITRKYTIELAVYVTDDLVEKHGNDTEKYVMALLSGADQHLHDPSLSVHVSIAVKKIVKVERIDGTQPDLRSNVVDDVKENFCQWQSVHQWKNDVTDPESYDLSLLLTRKKLLTKVTNVQSSGMAEIGGICQFSRACVVITDRGFPTIATIAHEIGHTMNLLHDNEAECQSLLRPEFITVNIMAPTTHKLTNLNAPWSRCSQVHIQEFFYSGIGNCLKNKPAHYMKFDKRLVGEIYTGTEQCKIDLDNPTARMTKSVHLPEGTNLCEELFCHYRILSGYLTGLMQMKSTHNHRADGTTCGDGHQCYAGNCLPSTQIKTPVAGGWSQWTPFRTCSKTCGGGIKTSERSCTNPTPRFGGKYCRGKQLRYRRCRTKPCANGSLYGRAEQCAAHNGRYRIPSLTQFDFAAARWVPAVSDNRCKLTCIDAESRLKTSMGNVVDGTRCTARGFNVCIRGVCRRSGCDGRLGSRKKLSRCGICGGSNKKCMKIKNTFRVDSSVVKTILTVPVGAYNFRIEQKMNNLGVNNFLSLSTADGNCLINCNGTLNVAPEQIIYGETTIKYSGYSETEIISTEGKPLTRELVVLTKKFNQNNANHLPVSKQRVPWYYWVSTSKKDIRNNH